jgi:hypothetical protein
LSTRSNAAANKTEGEIIDVFQAAELKRPDISIEIRSLPALAHCFPRSFTFYVAHPARSVLRKHGYPPDLQDEATKLVLAQAELLCAEWAA